MLRLGWLQAQFSGRCPVQGRIGCQGGAAGCTKTTWPGQANWPPPKRGDCRLAITRVIAGARLRAPARLANHNFDQFLAACDYGITRSQA